MMRWTGKCWYIHNLVRYEFDLQFEIPATYPAIPIELELPELDGKTHKMYRGGKICLDIHFAPYWRDHQPKLGIAHALALGVNLFLMNSWRLGWQQRFLCSLIKEQLLSEVLVFDSN